MCVHETTSHLRVRYHVNVSSSLHYVRPRGNRTQMIAFTYFLGVKLNLDEPDVVSVHPSEDVASDPPTTKGFNEID